MNIVPHVGFSPIPMLDRLMQVARQNPNAVAHIQRLAQRYGPVAMAHVRQFLDQAGYRAGRAVRDWIGRHVRPRRNQFMHNVRTGLARQQRVRALRDGHATVRRFLQRRLSSRPVVRSQPSSQYRGARGTVSARRRGGQGMRRGGMRLPRLRTGGRRIANFGPRPELKAYDKGGNNLSISSTISYITEPWNDISVGTASNNRVGRKVRTKSILLVGSVKTNVVTTITTASDTVWIWVVLDTQPNGAAASSTDIWSNNVAHTALKNLDQGGRFKIIKCIEVKMDYGQTGTTVNAPFEVYIPLRCTPVWKGLVNSAPYVNNLLVFAGNSNTAMSDFLIDIQCRTRYYDN